MPTSRSELPSRKTEHLALWRAVGMLFGDVDWRCVPGESFCLELGHAIIDPLLDEGTAVCCQRRH